MSYCETCREEIAAGEGHSFSGYGFYVTYCPGCCPRELDGSECGKEHPGDDTGARTVEVTPDESWQVRPDVYEDGP